MSSSEELPDTTEARACIGCCVFWANKSALWSSYCFVAAPLMLRIGVLEVKSSRSDSRQQPYRLALFPPGALREPAGGACSELFFSLFLFFMGASPQTPSPHFVGERLRIRMLSRPAGAFFRTQESKHIQAYIEQHSVSILFCCWKRNAQSVKLHHDCRRRRVNGGQSA